MLKITGTMMLVLMLTTLTASAAWVTPTTSDQSSSHKTYLKADTTINDNGMYMPIPDMYHDNDMAYSLFTPGEEGMMWLSDTSDTAPSVYYGFADSVTIDQLTIWNFNDRSQLSAGILEARVLYTTDTALALKDRSWSAAGIITVARGTGVGIYEANTLIDVATELPGLNEVELTGIMLEVISTYGSTQAGLSEIHFDGEVVPEPATMGLLAVGGMAMLRSRRRRNKK
jgi:hypothetical protein